MFAVDEFLTVLGNGGWHGLGEVADRAGLRGVKVEIVVSFLVKYGFLEFDEVGKRVKLSPELRVFLRKIEGVERGAVGR